LKTYTEQLEEIQECITNVLTLGQSVMSGDKKMGRADLDSLQQREAWLIPRVAKEKSKGKRNRVSYVVPI